MARGAGRSERSSRRSGCRGSGGGKSTSRWRSWRVWRVAAGATVELRVTQERETPTPGLYFGRGKVEEMGQAARDLGANLFISDDPLSPIQERNLSEALGIKVIDRTALILDIFAQRARTARGPAAGRAGPAHVSAAAAGRAVDATSSGSAAASARADPARPSSSPTAA